MTVEQIADRSMSIVTAYLAGELPPAMAAEVAKILRTEPWLRAAHAKLFAAWQAPNAERAVSDAETDAAYGRFKAMRTAKFGAGGREGSDT
jgi:anti-sigma factor RsiW